MKSKLAMILALAAFLALAATSTAPAALPLASVTSALLPGLTGSSESSSSAATTGSTTTPPSSTAGPSIAAGSPVVPQCADGIDNDGDGLIDMEDPDCSSPSDNIEGPEPAPPTPPPGTTVLPSSSTSPSTEAPQPAATETGKPHKAFERGESLEAAVEPDVRGGVTHNEDLGDASGGGKSGGGVKAPSATGGGTQPLAASGDGGAQFQFGGAPTLANPTTTIAPFGPAPIGVPNFVINSFEIPPFLLPIYQA
ncbi:MAG TPA: hypothetical protein VIJ21_10105, partial [Solirubrobacterales bacterium]